MAYDNFIFDDIASLAGSADAQNVDPKILKEICNGLKDENPYCADLRFLGVEARARAEGITVIPRMVDQVQHFDVCSVVNNRQTGAMTLQVRTHTNSVSDVNMDSEKVEGLCFPLLFPHGEPSCTNASKSGMSPDEGLLHRAGKTIAAAVYLENAAVNYAKEPAPTMVLKSNGTNLTAERISALLSAWKTARQSRSTAFLNADVNLRKINET